MSTNDSLGHGTESELNFLARLGQHAKADVRKMYPAGHRRTLLMRYQASMALRAKWGSIDPQKIAAYLKKELEKK